MITQDVSRYHIDAQNYQSIKTAIALLEKHAPYNHISISILREQGEAIKRRLDWCTIDVAGSIYDDFMKKF